VAFLYEGRIVEEGSPQQLRDSRHPAVQAFLKPWFGKQ